MIVSILKEIVITFTQMAPYLLLGLTFAGILHITFKKEFIIKHLGKNDMISSIKAAILGVPLPLCSCGVIPTALSLRKNKASDGATVSFLISTPQTGVDSIIATWGMLGPVFAIFRPLAALLLGITGGIITSLTGHSRKNKTENTLEPKVNECKICSVETNHKHSLMEKLTVIGKYAYKDFLDDISIQLLIGIAISGLISFYIPDNFFTKYISGGFAGMLLMIVVGVPMYVCATASIPIAVTLMMKGITAGAALVFLIVGPGTNATTITLIANVMGKRVVGVYLAVIITGAIIFGFMLDSVYSMLHINPSYHIMKHYHETTGNDSVVFALIFAVMISFSLYRKTKQYLIKRKNVKNNECCNAHNSGNI